MSAWRLAVRALYDHGPATSQQVELRIGGVYAHKALSAAVAYGLVHSPGKNNGTACWSLTPLGVDWCEGRVTQVEVRPGGRRWAATWLSSLPRDIRIA
jgi:hypothetical protein